MFMRISIACFLGIPFIKYNIDIFVLFNTY